MAKAKGRKKLIVIIALVLVVAIVAVSLFSCGVRKVKTGTTTDVSFQPVTRGNIQNSITGTGTVEPKDRYDITALVTGDILTAPYEEGDVVKEGDILYTIDDEDIQITINKKRNAITNAQMAYDTALEDVENLKIVADSNGKVTDLSIRVGDNASGMICQLTDTNTLVVDLPFSKAQINNISEGNSVTLVSADYMSRFTGTVTYVGNAAYAGTNGGVFYDVEVTCTNPGAIPSGTKVVGTVHTSSGDIDSPSEGVAKYPTSIPIKAKSNGEVVTLNVKEGQYITKGTVIAQLKSDSLDNTLRQRKISLEDAELDLESTMKNLENYNITSPIDGTVLTKTYKAGDTIGNGQNSAVLMSIVDMSAVKFIISADELDVGKIQVGQAVSVVADAMEDTVFDGYVSNVSGDGTASNGVTTYDVTIQIDEPGELKLGMNVEASIVVEESTDTLIAPVAGITETLSGTYAIVKYAAAAGNNSNSDADTNKNEEHSGNDSDEIPRTVQNMVIDGTKAVRVEVGINDENNIEILSGLNEGDEILVPNAGNGTITSTVGAQTVQGMGAMPGGMGAMPGGMGGSMPSGMGGGPRGGDSGGPRG